MERRTWKIQTLFDLEKEQVSLQEIRNKLLEFASPLVDPRLGSAGGVKRI